MSARGEQLAFWPSRLRAALKPSRPSVARSSRKLAPRLARMATMRRVVDGLSEAELDRVCGRRP
ncbi:hypothetical protein AB0K48_49680, partial [Nonomuraea sp. NPDC055795]